ncbi:MAG: acylphosphatase [Ethanoligenens sp.]
MKRYHMLVSGLVQGVGFRYFVWQTALRLGLIGWVKNLDSGEVELEAQGAPHKLDRFTKEVQKGPRFSHVDHVDIQEVEATSDTGFQILN